jgi:AcrR family transcriptional regulator
LADKQNLRADVINVARQLFMSKGYENVGMRDIAQVLGQQPTQVYRLNLCKADILAELILELNEAQIAKLPIIKTQIKGDSVLEKVSSYVDIEHLPLRKVAATHGWTWSLSYEEKHSKQVRQYLEPIETWMTDAGLTNVRARSLGIFSLYYIGYREAVIRQASASDCLKMIRTSLSYFCV